MSATTRVTYGSVRLACSSVNRFLTDDGLTLGGFLDCGAGIRCSAFLDGLASARSHDFVGNSGTHAHTHTRFGGTRASRRCTRGGNVWREPSAEYCDTRGTGVNYASARFVPRAARACKRGKLQRWARRRRVRIMHLDKTPSSCATPRFPSTATSVSVARRRLPEQPEHGRLFGRQAIHRTRQLAARLSRQRLGQRPIHVAVEDRRVHVAL